VIMRKWRLKKTRLLIETQRQKVIEKEGATERLVAMIQASKLAEMSRIRMEKEVLQKKAHQTIQKIENDIYAAKQHAKSDAEFYKASRLTLANNLKFTENYVQYQLYQSLKDRPKTYFGTNLTNMFLVTLSDLPSLQLTTQSDLQSLLQQFLNEQKKKNNQTKNESEQIGIVKTCNDNFCI